jgi:hypothetical protein
MTPEPLPFTDGATACHIPVTHDLTENTTGRVTTIQTLPIPAPQVPLTPMGLIQLALQGGAALDTVERLVALQKDQRGYDAELAFNAAMNRAQSEMGPVAADLTNPQTKSKYASYPALDKRVRPIYTQEGLALSFDTADSTLADHTRVLCYVSHSMGHMRTYHLDMPNDGKGAKGGDVMTKTHATGAAVSYGKRYLVIMVFNIAVGEDDRDGNAPLGLTEDKFQGFLKTFRESADMKALQEAFAKAWKAAGNDLPTKKALTTEYEKRKGELR